MSDENLSCETVKQAASLISYLTGLQRPVSQADIARRISEIRDESGNDEALHVCILALAYFLNAPR